MPSKASCAEEILHLGRPIDISSELISIGIVEEFGWRRFTEGPFSVWTKGYGKACDGAALARRLSAFRETPGLNELAGIVREFDGHFAIVSKGPGWAFASVDRVRSIPIAFAETPDGWLIDDQAWRLKKAVGLGPSDVDPSAALSLGMAGYTIDRETLFPSIRQLSAGELVLFGSGTPPVVERYYSYSPWRADKPAYESGAARKVLEKCLLAIIDEMMKGIGDRMLVVPLSAGRDSRLIVSAAVHLGYSNIRTFAYGRKGNHEAVTSKAIAERLGLEWRFVPCTVPAMRSFFSSRDYAAYLNFADSLQSVPFVQDMHQVMQLKETGYIPDDAIIANGNSGDYISGAHVIPEMQDAPASLDHDERLTRIIEALSKKHFSLWQSLRTPENLALIAERLKASIYAEELSVAKPHDDYGIFEYAEFQDRQTKYVISGERIYEYLGHEWRLPLWHNALLDFFEAVPLQGKVDQSLYADTLEQANWGGVWQDVPVNAKTIRPQWLVPLRWMAKAVHAPLGRDAWHRFERRYFQYFMDPTCNAACVPYKKAVLDGRGQRTFVSWLAEQYLERHGVADHVFGETDK